MYDVNIVIVNYKMKDDIDRCLFSLFNCLNNSKLKIRVCVVDNSQNIDGVKELLEQKYPLVKYLKSENNIGFSKAQNLGMKNVQTKYQFSLNPDVIFFKNSQAIERMYNFMENHPNIGIIGPKLLNFDNTLQYSCFRFPNFLDKPLRGLGFDKKYNWVRKRISRFLMKDFDHNKTQPVDWILGSAMFIRDSAIKKVNYFDERYFMYFEDCDLCRKMWKFGLPVYYVHNIELKHKYHRDSAKIKGLMSIIKNKPTRFHIKSWIQYFYKWRREKIV